MVATPRLFGSHSTGGARLALEGAPHELTGQRVVTARSSNKLDARLIWVLVRVLKKN